MRILKYLVFILLLILFNPSSVLSIDGSLWVGEKKKVIEVSTEDGEYLLEIPAIHLEDIAVDNYRGVIWVGTRKEIIQYSLTGEEIFRYSLNLKDDCEGNNCGERIVHISLDYSDGSLWIGAKNEVIKLAYDSHEFFRIKDVGHIVDVSVDISDGSCWVGLKDKAIKYSSNGTVLLGFDIENGNKIQALATDPLNNSLWIGTKKGLIEVDRDGFEQFRIYEPLDIQDLKIDINDALVWVVTKKEVFKYSSGGQKLLGLDPCSHDIKCEGNLITLAVDPYDSSCWIAWRKSLLKLSYIGEYLLWLNGFKQIEALDIGLSKLGIDITEPADGATVDTPSITVRGTVTDPTAGVTVNGIEAFVIGNSFEAQGVQLIPGNNTITATANNLAHISVSDTIHVTYQPLIPPLSIQIDSPVEGAVFSTSTIDVMGTVSDASASVDVNGAPASVIGNSFQVQGLQLNPGTNIITATAILSGISVWDSIIVTYQPLPPLTVEISSPVEGATFSTSRIDITGTVSDSKAKVTVNGIEATVSGNIFTAAGIPITVGENTITATATDEFGRTASDSVIVSYKWLDVTITYPANGDLFSFTSIDVEGTVSDPSAYVDVNGIEAVVSADGNFIAYGLRLSRGLNEIVAQATNQGGQIDIDTVKVLYEPPSEPLSVSILSPYDVSTIESGYFTVTGIVNDPEATVLVNDTLAHVEDNFYKTSIYACEPPVVPEAGPQQSWVCTVTVTAYSKDGQVATTSFTYTYSPSDDPLTVKITDPASNQIVTYSPYEVQGEFYDVLLAVSTATVKVNGIMAVVIDGNRFSAPVPLNDGLNYVTVRATNAVGHDAFDTIKIIYEPSDKPLGVTIYSPLDQAIVNYSPISVFGGVTHSTAEVDVSGIFADFNKDLRSFKATSVPLSPGENLITATVWIPTEETATVSITVTYDPDYPSPPPPVLSGLPEYAQSSVTVSGLTLPSYKVEIFANGTSRAVVWADSNGLFKVAISLPDEGPNHISARAIDIYGNKSNLSNEEVVIRDTIRPTIHQVKNHIDTLDLTASRVLLTGITEPLAEVDISIDYDPEYKYHTTADERGRFYIITHVSAGQHYVGIITKDNAGNKGSFSAPMHVHNVSPTLWGVMLLGSTGRPIPPKIDPIPNPINETSFAVEGNAYSYSLVEVYRNNELVGTVPANNRGRFRLDGVTLMPGRNIIKVRQKETQLDMGTWYLFLNAADSPEVAVDVISGTPTRPEVKIGFPVNGSITDAEFLALRGTIDTPDATLKLNGYYTNYGYAVISGNNFISNQKIPLLPGENTLWIEATSSDGSRGVDKITVYSKKDSQVPSVNITSPLEGEEIYDRYTSISGTVGDSVQRVIVNESEATLGNGSFGSLIDIFSSYVYNPYGYERIVTAWAMDGNGNIGHHDVPFRYRYIPTPSFSITSPLDGETLGSSPITVTGNIYNASEITVNGVPATIDKNMFTAQIDLLEGENTIIVIAKNTVKASVKTIYVTYIPGSTITLQSITIEPSSEVLPLGDTLQLRAIGTYSNGDKVDLTQVCEWMSSRTDIATVNKGLVIGQKMGSTTITATYGSVSGASFLTITDPALKSIILAYEVIADDQGTYHTFNPQMTIGDTLQFMAFGYYSDDIYRDISSKVTWGSSDATIAAIDAKGLATALSKGTTQISATYQSITGSSTLTVEPPPMYIFITSPVDDSTIDSGEITVTGTVITEAHEVGITVNGIVANVIGNQFVANNIPLIEGDNVIVAKAIDSNGATAETQIAIIAAPATNYITLTSNIESGIAPLEVTLRIDGSFSITDSTLSVTGHAGPEVLYSSADEYRIKMTVEGVYYFTASVTGADGNVYQDTIAIIVLNQTELDNLLRGKWEGIKGALKVKDVEKALNYFDIESRDRYGVIFEALKDNMPAILDTFVEFNFVEFYKYTIEYETVANENGVLYSYPITFIRSEDGIWRFRDF